MASSRHTDSPNSLRSKSRRSWFDAPPLTTLDPQDIKRRPRPKKLSPDAVETLTLTHFTSAPRLSFGKVKVGTSKFRNILIRNPHDYEQEVIIERFPFKRKFSTEHTRFIVNPNDVFDLEILWSPEEETSVREMILFHVNDVFRLQAYVFGTSEKPKPPRKVRKGILGPRVMQPISVLQTPALSRIKSSYDRASLESPMYRVSKLTEISEPVQPTEDLHRHCPSIQNKVTVTQIQETQLKENIENLKPGEDIHCMPCPLESTSVEIKLDEDEHPRQCRRMSTKTSPTLNTMSPIPVIDDVEKGFMVDSYFKSNDTGLELSQAVNKPKFGETNLKGTFLCQEALTKGESIHCPASGTVVLKPCHSDTIRIGSGRSKEEQEVKNENVSPSLMKKIEKDKLPSFAKANISNDIELKMRVNWSSPQFTGDGSTACQPAVSPNTQLNQSLNLISQMSTPLRGIRSSSHDSSSSVNASIISQGHGLVSPNSFMEDMRNLQNSSGRKRKIIGDVFSPSNSREGRSVQVPSPSKILDNSIPHDVIVEHLQKIQSSLHTSGSFINIRSPMKPNKSRTKRRSITSAFRQKEKQKVAIADASCNTRPLTNGSGGNVDKGKIDTKKIQRLKYGTDFLANASPRRGTFLVTRKSPNGISATRKKRSPFRGHGRLGKARKSPGSKKSSVGSKLKGGHSSTMETDVVKAKNTIVSSLQSAPFSNCQTPPVRRTSCVDDRTVVKSSSFANVEAGKLSIDKMIIDDTDSFKSCKRKSLFPSEIQWVPEERQKPTRDENVGFGSVVNGKDMANSVIFAIDRKEIFADKAGNVMDRNLMHLLEISPHLGTIVKNGQVIPITEGTVDYGKIAEQRQMGEKGDVSPEFHTPTNRLPETPDPLLSRRSTKVIRSPKVICVSTMQQKCLNFDLAVEPETYLCRGENINLKHHTAAESNIHSCNLRQQEELTTMNENQYSNTTSVIKILSPISSLHAPLVSNDSSLPSTTNSLHGSKINESDSLTTDSLETSQMSNPLGRNFLSPVKTLVSKCSRPTNDHEKQIVCRKSVIDHTEEQSQGGEEILNGLTATLNDNQSGSKLSNLEDTSVNIKPDNTNPHSATESKIHPCILGQEEKLLSMNENQKADTTNVFKFMSPVSSSHTPMVGNESAPLATTKSLSGSRIDESDSLTTDSLETSQTSSPLDRNCQNQIKMLASECSRPTNEQKEQIISGKSVSYHTEEQSQVEEEILSGLTAALKDNQSECKLSILEAVSADIKQDNTNCHSSTDSNINSCILGQESKLVSVDKNQNTNTTSAMQSFPRISSFQAPLVGNEPGPPTTTKSLPGSKINESDRANNRKKTASTVKSVAKPAKGVAPSKPTLVKKTSKTACTVKSVAKPVKGVAPSKLILMRKTSKTALPKHPMPFAARNMYYDERWMEKQERGFVQWLNFVLTPPEEYVAVSKHSKIDAGSLALSSHQVAPRLAPTKEILSFRAYAARRRLNRLRRAACELYHSENFVSVIHKIEIEVESRRLAVRKEKMIHADLGIRQKLLDLLLQYSSLWLRIGLETVFGEMLLLQSNTDIVGLSRFIVTRLLGSPDIAKEYAHATVPHLYKDGFAEALSRHSLKKFLLLVYFLDQAKVARLIDHDPCLFYKDSTIKSSKEVLVEFSREILSGEGDLVRHLAYLGYSVSHKQNPIDEFDYAVTNLCTDLKDGLRLSRVVELLASDIGAIGKLRAPAISRLQKIHNMEVFFNHMKKQGLNFVTDQRITTRDVVDGHREKTLSLLWHLILHFQANIQVNEEHLQEEINLLTKSLQLKLAMQKIGVLQYQECLARRDSGDGQCLSLSARMQLIFRWCQLVCLHYGIKIENFTVSFSDGRAFCCLLHHYHPVLLPQSEINFETTLSFQADAEALCDEEDANLSSNCSGFNNGLLQSEADPAVFQRLLSNEKVNFKTLYDKVSALGGVPLMVKSTDMSNTIPDEKVVSTYVAYLCARLLDIREEVKAARVIQMAWRRRKLHRDFCARQKAVRIIQHNFRKYLLRKRAREMKFMEEKQREKEKAAVVIQRYFRSTQAQQKFFAYRKSALIIQRLWRKKTAIKMAKIEVEERKVMKAAENRRKMEQSALVIQKHFRGWLTRKRFHKNIKSAVCIQKWWRGCLARLRVAALRLERQNRSAAVIQKWVRGMLCRRDYQRKWLHILLIQRHWRMTVTQRQFNSVLKQRNAASLLIQKVWKGRVCAEQFKTVKNSALCIQSYWRGYLARKYADTLRQERRDEASRIIQRSFHSYRVRKSYLQKRQAAHTIQRCWRSFLLRREERRKRLREVEEQRKRVQATVVIQKNVRGWLQRGKLQNEIKSALCIQRWWRGFSARKLAISLRHDLHSRCAIVIQKWVRRRICMQSFHIAKSSTLLLQTQWRMVLARRYFKQVLTERTNAAIIIQKLYRAKVCSKQFTKMKKSAIHLQSCWRSYKARLYVNEVRFARREKAAIIIQKTWRAHCMNKRFCQMKTGAIVLQKYCRRWLAQKKVCCLVKERRERAAIRLQKYFRMWMTRGKFQSLKKATIKVQSRWRMKQAIQQLNHLKSERNAKCAICIQTAWRGHRSRKNFLDRKYASITIQAFWRMFSQKKHFLQQKLSAVIIQRKVKATLLAKHERGKYLRLRKSVIYIQSLIRRRSAREQFLSLRKATIKVQSRWRMKQAVQQLNRLKSERNAKCAVCIQSAWRGYRSRKNFLERKYASIAIQAFWRMFSQKKHFLQQKLAAVIIQRRVKATLLAKHEKDKYLKLRKSVIYMQSLFRRRKAVQEFDSKKKAAIIIQSFFRMYKRRIKYLALRLATVIVQKYYRNYCYARHVREEYLTIRQSAIVLQRCYRQHLHHKTLKQETSAITLQAAVRGFLAFRKFQKQKKAAATIQNKFRSVQTMKVERKEYLDQRNAVIKIQSFFRMHLAQKHLLHLKLLYKREQESATKIQSFFKGYKAQKEYKRCRNAVVVLQRWFRSAQMMKHEREKFVTLRSSVVKIQSLYRMHLVRTDYREKRSAVICLQAFARRLKAENSLQVTRNAVLVVQSHYRAWKTGKFHRSQFLALRHAAMLIQQRYRQKLIVREQKKMLLMQHNAATKIQSFYKAKRQSRKYISLLTSVICIQQRFRAIIEGRLVRIKLQEELSASKLIQRAWRKIYYKKKALEICQLRRLEIEEQRRQRAEEERAVRRQHQSALVIQRAFRIFMLKKREQEVMAATVIQAFVRQILARRKYLNLRQSAMCIQAHWRGYRCRQGLKTLMKKHQAARLLQANVRGYLTRKRILPELKARFQEMEERRLREKSATKIQALWRGFVLRRDNTNKRLLRARKRVEDVNRSATEEKSLGYRTSLALDFLFKDKDLSYILEALMHLEVATRLSPLCCERVVEVNAIAILFHLISSCNRSVPHMEIIRYSIDIILNLAKYQKTVDAILVVPEATAILLDLMQIYREKGIIFLKTCQLLSILAADPYKKEIILTSERIQERLQSIHSLVLRKHRSQQAHQVTKAKMVAMKSFNSTLPVSSHLVTPSKRHHVSPEWHLGAKKPKEFDNPLTAISSVLNVLRIGPK